MIPVSWRVLDLQQVHMYWVGEYKQDSNRTSGRGGERTIQAHQAGSVRAQQSHVSGVRGSGLDTLAVHLHLFRPGTSLLPSGCRDMMKWSVQGNLPAQGAGSREALR